MNNCVHKNRNQSKKLATKNNCVHKKSVKLCTQEPIFLFLKVGSGHFFWPRGITVYTRIEISAHFSLNLPTFFTPFLTRDLNNCVHKNRKFGQIMCKTGHFGLILGEKTLMCTQELMLCGQSPFSTTLNYYKVKNINTD